MDRRTFLESCAAAGAIAGLNLHAQSARPSQTTDSPSDFGPEAITLPDHGWNLWIDQAAPWEDDAIYLPDDVDLKKLPINSPTGGWDSLYARTSGDDYQSVTLPTTVEQFFWGKFGQRPYTPEEYRFAADDPIPQNGAYRGVSWWWRTIDIPAAAKDKRIFLHLRGARMRAEVYLNGKLTGYSIMEELPFECELTDAANPGGANHLAIRITNPGGRYDWVDGTVMRWGKVNIYRSHGFAGLDRELTVYSAPLTARIAGAWVLNTPEPKTVTAFAQIEGRAAGPVKFEVLDPATGRLLVGATAEAEVSGSKDVSGHRPRQPALPRCKALGSAHSQSLSPPRAVFRLNGRRIKLFSSISWGFWGMNGLWPTPALAEREVRQAQRLGLNCLNFHRNVGKEDVFRAHDRLGLLRYMEPGGGKLAIGRVPSGVSNSAPDIVMQKPDSEANLFSQRFMLAKCRAMVRAFRSHPSLIQYTLQNEIGADLDNPETFTPLEIMHQEDPSRSVVLNDGFSPPPRSAPQAWFPPYHDTMLRSDQEPWADWWNNHQGAGDQWYDEFYKDADNYTYRQPLKTSLVEFGEMEGCAVADHHAMMVHQIETREFGGNGKSYDLDDHQEILAAYNHFLDRWGFRGAFPTAADLFRDLGGKCYQSWQQYMENIRICDAVDFGVISGWESTAIENHSGIVDNLRNFKGDPELIASSLRPVRPVAKQHHLCYALDDRAVFDLYLLNSSGKPVAGKLRFSMVDPDNKTTELGSWTAPAPVEDQFSYTLQTGFTTPSLSSEGIYRFRFTSDSLPSSNFEREIWVANTKPNFARSVTIGVSGILASTRRQLSALPGVSISDFSAGQKYHLIVAGGVVRGSLLDRPIGEETGLEPPPRRGQKPAPQTPGHIPAEVLAAVNSGTPLLAIVPDDSLADGVAAQLAAAGSFTYHGQVGDLRAPWMGCWLFVRQHPTFAGLPANRVLGIHYQAPGKQSNGLLIDRAAGAPDPEVILGHSRDHARQIGAASFICCLGGAAVLVHRAPAFSAPLQQRWLANAIAHLTATELA
jgi:beta-galactosidase